MALVVFFDDWYAYLTGSHGAAMVRTPVERQGMLCKKMKR